MSLLYLMVIIERGDWDKSIFQDLLKSLLNPIIEFTTEKVVSEKCFFRMPLYR